MKELGLDTITVMRKLKHSLDPKLVFTKFQIPLILLIGHSWLLNPGKVFDAA